MARRHRWNPVCPPPRGLVRPVPRDPLGLAGPTRGQASGPAWRRTSHGYYVPAGVDGSVVEQRILEQSVRLPPGGAVTGWAACRLHGAAFFDGLAADGLTALPVPLCTGSGQIRPAPEVTVLRGRLSTDEVTVRHGIPCTCVLRAAFDAMRTATTVRVATEIADMVCAARLASLRRLGAYVASHAGWKGAPRARAGLVNASEHSRSPAETRMRLLWTLDAGLPAPLVNHPVFDLEGRLLGIPDLLDVESGLAGEYDGADHRSAGRHSEDVGREHRFRRVGLEVCRVTGPDLAHRDRVVTRIRESRARALWEPVGQRRWTAVPPPWWETEPGLDDDLDTRDVLRELALGPQEAQM